MRVALFAGDGRGVDERLPAERERHVDGDLEVGRVADRQFAPPRTSQVTVVPAAAQPSSAETKSTPAGSGSVTLTLWAIEGPWFSTCST